MHQIKYFFFGLKTMLFIVLNKLFGYSAPLLAYILVTNRCNLNCVYCFSNAHRKQSQDIPLEKIFTIVDQLKKAGTILITVSGGEPCLHHDIGEIISYIKKKGLLVELVTNGHKFEEHLDIIKQVDFLAISVDGDEEAHDKNRGTHSYKVAINALDLALANKIHTRIHACFSRYNAHSLPDLMRICKKYNVRANIAVPSVHTTEPALGFNDEEIRAYYNEMKEYKKKGYPLTNSASTLDYISKWPGKFNYISDKKDPGIPFIRCKRKDFSIYINVDGCAYPCATVWEQHHFNVFDKGVKAAFDEFKNIPCQTCVCETEFHLLFNGSFSSIINVAAFGLWDKLRKAFK